MSIIEQSEILRRRDMRDVFTFTIDPADAKDFDDALSFDVNEDGTYQIGVHIADVSFYVRPNTKVDDDAYKRGTSVYLVDRVLPMLPEELCNDKCSLRPNEDKLCMSVVFTMDADARVLKYKICRTVIRSNARLNYDEAQAVIEANQTGERESRQMRIETISEVSRGYPRPFPISHRTLTGRFTYKNLHDKVDQVDQLDPHHRQNGKKFARDG